MRKILLLVSLIVFSTGLWAVESAPRTPSAATSVSTSVEDMEYTIIDQIFKAVKEESEKVKTIQYTSVETTQRNGVGSNHPKKTLVYRDGSQELKVTQLRQAILRKEGGTYRIKPSRTKKLSGPKETAALSLLDFLFELHDQKKVRFSISKDTDKTIELAGVYVLGNNTTRLRMIIDKTISLVSGFIMEKPNGDILTEYTQEFDVIKGLSVPVKTTTKRKLYDPYTKSDIEEVSVQKFTKIKVNKPIDKKFFDKDELKNKLQRKEFSYDE